ncbi:hypothetical protein ABRT01_05565 [Lentibacillus sp. L22]|nr:hypothetical protein [Lentibacillus daqui]
MMKKLLVTFLFVLIVGFSIVGVAQYSSKSDDVIKTHHGAISVQS